MLDRLSCIGGVESTRFLGSLVPVQHVGRDSQLDAPNKPPAHLPKMPHIVSGRLVVRFSANRAPGNEPCAAQPCSLLARRQLVEWPLLRTNKSITADHCVGPSFSITHCRYSTCSGRSWWMPHILRGHKIFGLACRTGQRRRRLSLISAVHCCVAEMEYDKSRRDTSSVLGLWVGTVPTVTLAIHWIRRGLETLNARLKRLS